MDFIALPPDGKLWLIEVKNFRPRVSDRNGQEYRADRKPPGVLAEHVATKFFDSQRLIRIVDTYLRKNWWRRLQLWWLGRLRRPLTDSNYWFWSEARRRCEIDGSLVFVLWMETPERKTDYDDELEELLLERMPAGERVVVAEASRENDLPFGVVEEGARPQDAG